MDATLGSLATVFGWAFFSFWSAIPAGIALGLPPVLVGLTVTLSYSAGAAAVLLLGAPLRDRIQRRLAQRADAADEPPRMVRWARMAWERYGLVGLGLLAPMTIGSQTGAVIGLSFGGQPRRLWLALTLGAAAWALVLTLAAVVAGEALFGLTPAPPA